MQRRSVASNKISQRLFEIAERIHLAAPRHDAARSLPHFVRRPALAQAFLHPHASPAPRWRDKFQLVTTDHREFIRQCERFRAYQRLSLGWLNDNFDRLARA